MKISLIIIFISNLLFSCNFTDNRKGQPTELKVEFTNNVDSTKKSALLFSWKVNPINDESQQVAFQIFVSSTENKANMDKGDFWDSGKISSPKYQSVVYQGKKLKLNEEYFWKVRIWYPNGKPSSYSDIQKFRTEN